MKKFWKRHKHTFKYSLLFVVLGVLIFTGLFRMLLVWYLYDIPNYDLFERNLRVFVLFSGMGILYAIIPGFLGGIILNYWSIKRIKSNSKNGNGTVIGGVLWGGISTLMIVQRFVMDNIEFDGVIDRFEQLILILGIGAVFVAALAGGLTGRYIHTENLRRHTALI